MNIVSRNLTQKKCFECVRAVKLASCIAEASHSFLGRNEEEQGFGMHSMFLLMLLLLFWVKVSQYNWAGLKLTLWPKLNSRSQACNNPPASVPWVLGLQLCTTTPGYNMSSMECFFYPQDGLMTSFALQSTIPFIVGGSFCYASRWPMPALMSAYLLKTLGLLSSLFPKSPFCVPTVWSSQRHFKWTRTELSRYLLPEWPWELDKLV